MASARTRAAVAGQPLAREIDETPENEKPDRQLEILTPKTLGYSLSFEREVVIERIGAEGRTREAGVERFTRPIEISTEMTVGQILKRDDLDELEAFFQITILELRRLAPVGDPRQNSLEYLAAAVMRRGPRKMLREFISSVGRYTDTEAGRLERPTVEDIETGMDASDLNTVGLYFITNMAAKRAEKKALAEG